MAPTSHREVSTLFINHAALCYKGRQQVQAAGLEPAQIGPREMSRFIVTAPIANSIIEKIHRDLHIQHQKSCGWGCNPLDPKDKGPCMHVVCLITSGSPEK